MPTLPLHPAAVHVPLGLAAVLPLVAIAAAILAFRRGSSRGLVLLVVGLQALVFGSGLLASQLGERDEDRVEAVAGEAAIERHEDRAEQFVWAAGLVLAGAAAVLLVPRRAQGAGLAAVAVGTLAVAALAFRAGEAGGELVYARGGAAAWQAAAAGAGPVVADDHEDD
ncbi:MAG TPA: hypothetical protein VD838_19510 [Anaeromyxobacteraceae bacterium]|nr:hypothetical protein [Anaeromyxobacteraceae bacterium]